MCVMDCLIFTQEIAQFHITCSHTSHLTATPTDPMVCVGVLHMPCGCIWHWIEEILTWSPWLCSLFQDLMCVMDWLIFTQIAQFHITCSHTSHLTATPTDHMVCVGVFHMPCGCMALD